MAGATEHVRIKGQRELEAAFLKLRRDVLIGLKPAILEVAQTVRLEAESQAVSQIKNIGTPWSRMRIGVTVKGAYVAPKSRRRRGSPRRNLGGELLEVMNTAVDKHKDDLFVRLDELVTVSSARAGLL